MEERVVWRCRAPSPLEVRVEVIQRGDDLFYRRLFEGEVVVESPITPEQAGQAFFHLLGQGWRTE